MKMMKFTTMVAFATVPYYTFRWLERSFAEMKEDMPHCFIPAMALESVLTALEQTVKEMEEEDAHKAATP